MKDRLSVLAIIVTLLFIVSSYLLSNEPSTLHYWIMIGSVGVIVLILIRLLFYSNKEDNIEF